MAKPTPAQRRRSLLILGALLALGLVGIFIVIANNRSYLSSQEPFVRGLEAAKASPEVISRLGEPIEPGWFFRGRMMLNDRKVQGGFAIPLHGPKGDATLHIGAEHTPSGWRYDHFDLEYGAEGAPRIPLTPPASSAPPAEPVE